MAFAENAPGIINEVDSQRSAVLESESKRNVDPLGGIPAGVEIDRTFDAKQSGNRKARTIHHSLVPADFIANLSQGVSVAHQLPDTGAVFNEFHHAGEFYLAPRY